MNSNKASTLLLIDLSTGAISRMGNFFEEKEYVGNYHPDTCIDSNHSASNCAPLILPAQTNTFWLVLTQYELEALDLLSRKSQPNPS